MNERSDEELAELIREREALRRGDPLPAEPPPPPRGSDEAGAANSPPLIPISWEVVWSVVVALLIYSVISGVVTWVVLSEALD